MARIIRTAVFAFIGFGDPAVGGTATRLSPIAAAGLGAIWAVDAQPRLLQRS